MLKKLQKNYLSPVKEESFDGYNKTKGGQTKNYYDKTSNFDTSPNINKNYSRTKPIDNYSAVGFNTNNNESDYSGSFSQSFERNFNDNTSYIRSNLKPTKKTVKDNLRDCDAILRQLDELNFDGKSKMEKLDSKNSADRF